MQTDLSGANFIAGKASTLGEDKIFGVDPTSGESLPTGFSVATEREISEVCLRAKESVPQVSAISSSQRADFLDCVALELEAVKEQAVDRAGLETGLPRARLLGEVGRTQNQMRMFAALIREGSWVDARIEHGDSSRQPLPKPDLRRMLIPLGPVAVFGASNFPFAYSVAGGDTASALAAGCPVVAKAHPSHPGTSEWAAKAINSAILKTNMPSGAFSMVHGGAKVGEALVVDDAFEAIGFTGSLRGGTAIMKAAANRPRPIPVFAEMGSINPIVVLPSALAEAGQKVAQKYVDSLTLGVGQFCTNPGLIVGIGSEFGLLCEQIVTLLASAPAGTMLTQGIRGAFLEATAKLDGVFGSSRAARSDLKVEPRFYTISSKEFIAQPHFVEEIFGPAGIGIRCDSADDLFELLDRLPGQLTASVQAGAEDNGLTTKVLQSLIRIAGRIIYNGAPTGVEVNSAIQHGGPFPATSDSRSTSVGTAAIFRFVRPVAYQDWPDSLLPEALQEANPLNLRRLVEGKWES
jgi:alpha-ketoglutaric semialdehyde dehydrogenase